MSSGGGYPQSPFSPGLLINRGEGQPLPLTPPDIEDDPRVSGSDPTRRIALPGANFAPIGSIVIDEIGDGDIAAGATATLITTTVPAGYNGRLAGIGFSADDETSLRFLTWSIRTDPPNAPLPGYNVMPAAVGSVNELSPIDAFILASGVDTIVTVTATNGSLAAVPYHYVARLRGWNYQELGG